MVIWKISQELSRGERSVRMNLFFMDLIEENELTKDFEMRFKTMICMTSKRSISVSIRQSDRLGVYLLLVAKQTHKKSINMVVRGRVRKNNN